MQGAKTWGLPVQSMNRRLRILHAQLHCSGSKFSAQQRFGAPLPRHPWLSLLRLCLARLPSPAACKLSHTHVAGCSRRLGAQPSGGQAVLACSATEGMRRSSNARQAHAAGETTSWAVACGGAGGSGGTACCPSMALFLVRP